VNSPEQAREHLVTIRDPLGLANDAIGNRRVDDRDECVSFLLEALVRLAYKYEPTAKGAHQFSDFAAFRLHRLRHHRLPPEHQGPHRLEILHPHTPAGRPDRFQPRHRRQRRCRRTGRDSHHGERRSSDR
jgi:hypothetical protein